MKLLNNKNVSLVSPAVLSINGSIEDSARRYPTIKILINRKLGIYNDIYSFKLNDPVFEPEWIAGIFLLIRSADYKDVEGFDKNFFYSLIFELVYY